LIEDSLKDDTLTERAANSRALHDLAGDLESVCHRGLARASHELAETLVRLQRIAGPLLEPIGPSDHAQEAG
jgi:hypothetical protein